MDADEAVRLTREHIERQFPKICTQCGRTFASLGEYIRDTERVGDPVSYDAERKVWKPRRPVGTLAFANCSCGTTLTVSSRGMELRTLWRIMWWARAECRRRGQTFGQILAWMRAELRRQVLPSADASSGQT